MYSYGPPHMAGQKHDDLLEHTYCSYVRIRDVALKTCQRRWTRGSSGERGSGKSVPLARHDYDDDDIANHIHAWQTKETPYSYFFSHFAPPILQLPQHWFTVCEFCTKLTKYPTLTELENIFSDIICFNYFIS